MQTGISATSIGGTGNRASGNYATIGGGVDNRVFGDFGYLGGGENNDILSQADWGVLAGGENNILRGLYSAIGGGKDNVVDHGADYVVISGGELNIADAPHSTVGGGWGNLASGHHSTIPGGFSNIASGEDSFAAGQRAHAVNIGSFVWADSTDADFVSTADDQFSVRAAGGVRIVGDLEADSFNYGNTQTRSVVIAPGELSGPTSTDFDLPSLGATAFIKSGSITNRIFATVPLIPDGAKIVKFECIVTDDGPGTVHCTLIHKVFDDNPSVIRAQLTSGANSPNAQTLSTTTITLPFVNRDDSSMMVKYSVTNNNCDNSCKIHGFRITYEVTKAD